MTCVISCNADRSIATLEELVHMFGAGGVLSRHRCFNFCNDTEMAEQSFGHRISLSF